MGYLGLHSPEGNEHPLRMHAANKFQIDAATFSTL